MRSTARVDLFVTRPGPVELASMQSLCICEPGERSFSSLEVPAFASGLRFAVEVTMPTMFPGDVLKAHLFEELGPIGAGGMVNSSDGRLFVHAADLLQFLREVAPK